MKSTPFSWQNVWRLARGRMPGQVVIQYTDRCNATCPQCEMRRQNDFPRTSLDVETGKRILDAARQRGIAAVSFTGGEPFLARHDILELVRHASELGFPYIRTGTNGFMLMGADKPGWEARVHQFAQGLAETKIYTFWISIDSVEPEVHETMRGLPGVMDGIERALPIFEQYGIFPSANLGINRNMGGDYRQLLPLERNPQDFDAVRFYDHFRRSFGRFYQRATDLGFTIINMCYPMSVDPVESDSGLAVYAATSADRIVRFTREEKVQLFTALLDTVPEYRDKIRIFTPLTSVLSLLRQYRREDDAPAYGCRGGIDFFFVNSTDGNAYPCGYRGHENLGKFWDLDLGQRKTARHCTDCDWECFRDPSELAGPLLEFPGSPFRTAARFWHDRVYARHWWEDVRYYRACDYFSGRVDADRRRLATFACRAATPVALSAPFDSSDRQPVGVPSATAHQ